jgi:hypothetical protein
MKSLGIRHAISHVTQVIASALRLNFIAKEVNADRDSNGHVVPKSEVRRVLSKFAALNHKMVHREREWNRNTLEMLKNKGFDIKQATEEVGCGL